ncbi:D-alanine--poly(phosphoribitol) ligase [Amycolatopsis coloradensis]|uniref:D-alanine--poly(Phosphoribitol) ligase n=1 Tax=Amycolatopsis coloradensis TaxID=76021 RepID=A0A1R0KR03_9PSEU|nr:AMP-binding protein [Amycolatopsis coloradensis]OLZ50107.1 D-alanine--poly(phosphoribitol) ligase [Amycolatopsis coloradensis]
MTGILDGVTEAARRDPGAIALQVGVRALRYDELLDRAARIAAAVRARVDGPVRTVGLLCGRTPAAYAGYLAVLALGATVVPMSARWPAARVRAVSSAAGVQLVLTDAETDAGGLAVPDDADVSTGPIAWPDQVGDPDDVAYVLFTSGSTGRPKGVPIRHRNLIGYLGDCIRRYDVGPGSRLSQTFALTFDPSVFDLFVAWRAGAALVVPGEQDLVTPTGFVRSRSITHWFSVPSIITLARRLRALRPGSMPDLRWSLFAGERLTLEQARAWSAAAPRSTVENLYGPTELTITCTRYRLPAGAWPSTANGSVPIGLPNEGLDAVVLDERGHPADEGQLAVRGLQRFDGYLDASDNTGRFTHAEDGVTAESYYLTGDRVAWTDGNLLHLGRIDDQVKVNGQRVEPGEIEAVLRALPGVDDVAVVAGEPEPGRVDLRAFYTGAAETCELSEQARAQLPPYMVPSRFDRLEALPVTDNGKTDRRRLTVLTRAGR